MASIQEKAPTSEPSKHTKPKVSIDEDDALTADFSEKLEWKYSTEWTCKAIPEGCDVQLRRKRGVVPQLSNLSQTFDSKAILKLTRLRNTTQNVMLLVFGHDTMESALKTITKFYEVKNTVLRFMQGVDRTVTTIQVTVQHKEELNSPQEHQGIGRKCLYESKTSSTRNYTSETIWFCKPETPANIPTSNRHFTNVFELIRRKYRSHLRIVQEGSVQFTVYHEKTADALEMISKYEEVRAMLLECLHGIDSTVTDIQMHVQLRNFIVPLLPLPEHGQETYVDEQEPDQVVSNLEEQVAHETLLLRQRKAMELSDMRLSMWTTRPGSPQPSDSSGIDTATDTTTDVDSEEFPDIEATPTSARRYTRADANLHDACRKGNLAEVKRILDTGRADVSCREVFGRRTPVMAAAQRGHRDVVEFLVSQGADVSLVDDSGDNILHLACLGGDRKTVEFVLSLVGMDINSRGRRSRTPVMRAAWQGHRDVVELLVRQSADVSLVDDVGNNILHLACLGGDRKVVEFVLSLDGVDVNARNGGGQTAADVAKDEGHTNVVELLSRHAVT